MTIQTRSDQNKNASHGEKDLIHFDVFQRQSRMIAFFYLLLCLMTTFKLSLSGKSKSLLFNLTHKYYFKGTPKQNSSIVEGIVSNRNGFRDICVDLSSFNTECRYKHCDTLEQYRSIHGCYIADIMRQNNLPV